MAVERVLAAYHIAREWPSACGGYGIFMQDVVGPASCRFPRRRGGTSQILPIAGVPRYGSPLPRRRRGTRLEMAPCHLDTIPSSRGIKCAGLVNPSETEGAGNAGCAARTHGLACEMKKHTSKFTTGNVAATDIPRAMVLRLTPRSPRRSGFLSPSSARIA